MKTVVVDPSAYDREGDAPPRRPFSRTIMWDSMIRTAALLLALGFVAGCASSASDGWTKPGATPEEIQRDSADCLLKAQTVAPGRDGPRTIVNHERYRQCMANRGYTAGPAK
jgi:hypothetical protein